MACGCSKGLAEGQTRNAPSALIRAGWVMAGVGWRRKGSSDIVSLTDAMAQEGYTYDEELKLWTQSS
ncbi:MAG: hypothetical protein KBF47_13915 [Gemmatimonadales bacterium]|nr:hypothetical protein [Gemmatimonadales bacterium]